MSEEDQNPFVSDDVVDESEQTCWRDSGRMCGDDCVAYDEKCETDPRWLPCMLLNIQRAQARSFSNIATELKRQNDMSTTVIEQAEEANEQALSSAKKHADAKAYADHVRDTDPGPPEIKT